jgi:hypothetical protein
MIVKFNLICGLVNGRGPDIDVLLNHETNMSIAALTNNLVIEVTINNMHDSIISFVHKNKTDSDTIIINGSIAQDKFFKVNKIWVDDILLPETFCYGQATPMYTQGFLASAVKVPPTTYSSDNLYFNGTLYYEFSKNFFNWYHEVIKQQDLTYITGHHDPEAEQKYLGYQQESAVELEIIKLLENHGYYITS